MFRKSMIAFATVACLGAASLVPAAAAGPMSGPAAAQSGVVKVDSRYDGRGYRGDDRRQVQKHNGRGRPQQVCRLVNVRTVQWTKHGKQVRMVPQRQCQRVYQRHH